MKVKISYTTNFDDVPNECRNLIKNKIGNAHEVTNYITEILNHIDTTDAIKAVDQIHQLRLVLSTYDQCLSDVTTILNGWLNVKLQNNQERDNVYEQQPEQEQQQDYQQVLEKLRNTLQMAGAQTNDINAQETESI